VGGAQALLLAHQAPTCIGRGQPLQMRLHHDAAVQRAAGSRRRLSLVHTHVRFPAGTVAVGEGHTVKRSAACPSRSASIKALPHGLRCDCPEALDHAG
jgi:hypothetical protein